MKSSFVAKKAFNSDGYRFDASFHLSEGVAVKRKITACPYSLLSVGEVSSDVFYGNRAKRVYVSDLSHGIPFLSGSDILALNLDNVKLASRKYTPGIEQLRLKEGWILVSRSGTVGKTAWSNKIHAKMLATEDVIRIIPNNTILGGCLYAYLSSKYGYSLLTQGTFGAVIQHIEPEFVRGIPVPKFADSFQREVHELICESSVLREDAEKEIRKAIVIMSEKTNFSHSYNRIFTKNLKSLKFSWAAFNNNEGVDSIIDSYKDNSERIDTITSSVFAPPLFKHLYLSKNNGYPFMTGSEMTKYNMRYYRWLSPRGVRNINDYVVSKGTLLLYKSGTTDGGILGNVFIADDSFDGCCLSDHVIRMRFDDEKRAFWAFAFFRTPAGIHLLQSLATGTMIPFITPERIKELPLPVPDQDFDLVCSLVESYINKISESKQKENLAIDMVEDEIDKWK